MCRKPVAGFAVFLLLANPATADEISDACNESLTDVINTLRACDVVIGRQNTDRASRIRAFQTRAKAHLAAGNLKAALNDFSSAISALPDGKLKGYVLFLRAQSRFDYGNRTQQTIAASLDDLEVANGLASGNPGILETLSRVYLAAERYRDAIWSAETALTHDPRMIVARKTRARAFEAMGRTRDALTDLDILLKRQLADPGLLAWRGRLHEKRRNIRQALADYRNAARIKTTQELLDGIKRMEKVLGKQ